jgi:hypothetical protein
MYLAGGEVPDDPPPPPTCFARKLEIEGRRIRVSRKTLVGRRPWGAVLIAFPFTRTS